MGDDFFGYGQLFGVVGVCYGDGVHSRGLAGLQAPVRVLYDDAFVGGDSASYGGAGLVKWNDNGTVTACFWDTQTSGQAESDGGIGKTTAEMQTVSMFHEAGWDFVVEAENGTEDIWWILESQDYPRLWWGLIPEN